MLGFSITLFITCVGFTSALEGYATFSEGKCQNLTSKAVDYDHALIDTFLYLSAGSKYQMYRYASLTSNYNQMREFEFYYNYCYHRNVTNNATGSYVYLRAFGELFQVYRKTYNAAGKYTDYVSVNPLQFRENERKYVTLTDNATYAFLGVCWLHSDQMGWLIVQKDKELSAQAQKAIEDHAVSLGFDRKKFVFLKYDTCRRW